MRKLLHASTATPLAAVDTFNAGWQQVSRHPVLATQLTIPRFHEAMRLQGFVESDQNSAAAGVRLEMGNDQANPEIVQTWTYNTPSTALSFDILLIGQWVRMSYTNGVIAQARFRFSFWLIDPAGVQ